MGTGAPAAGVLKAIERINQQALARVPGWWAKSRAEERTRPGDGAVYPGKLSPVRKLFYLLFPIALLLSTCSEDGGVNVFSIEQDLELGQQTRQQILDNPGEFPVLDRAANPEAYNYLQGMVDEIVRVGDVPNADVFPYEVTIINDTIRNAFATPGGFLYVYTGLIQFLDAESQLAGVMAHEIAHSAERHSTEQLTQQFGLSTLISLVTGSEEPGLIEQVAGSLASLRFSRGDEEEADARSVDYLCNSAFAANGAAGFFEMTQGAAGVPEFLSTHPNPGDRVEDINARARDMDCGLTGGDDEAFRRFQALLR